MSMLTKLWRKRSSLSLKRKRQVQICKEMTRIQFDPKSLDSSNAILIDILKSDLQEDPYWTSYLADNFEAGSLTNIHLAIFVEPFLQYLLDGKKTIESRFSINRCPPFNRVSKGDVVLVKKSGGPIMAVCLVKERWYYRLNPNSWSEIKQYQEALCAQDPDFWESKKDASFATLIMIDQLREVTPIDFDKRDRRGWVVLSNNTAQYSLL